MIDPYSAPMHPAALKGIALFNQGEFFEAHEALEEAWNESPEPVRGFYKGILQVAVCYFHMTRNNYEGAWKLYQRAQKWLIPLPAEVQGVNVAQLRRDFDAMVSEMQRLGAGNLQKMDFSAIPPILLNIDPKK